MSESALPEHRPVFIDIAILLAIPAILSAFHFFLPDATYNQLVFTYGDPSLVTVCHLHLGVTAEAAEVDLGRPIHTCTGP